MLNQTPSFGSKPNVRLTLAKATEGNASGSVSIPASKLLAYYQQMGFTRLKLIGGIILEVKETTDQIDRLVRAAAAYHSPALQ